MKKTLSALLVATIMAFTGCDSDDTLATTSNLTGRAIGMTCELSGIKPEVKTTITNVLTVVSGVIPASNETFVVSWTPIIEKETTKNVESKKITAEEAKLVVSTASVACMGLDYLFGKFPDAKNVESKMSIAVRNFVDGFVSVVGSSGKMMASKPTDEEMKIIEEFSKFKNKK